MKNTYIYIVFAILITIGVSLYIGKSIGEKNQKAVQAKTQIKVIHIENKSAVKKIDSLGNIIKSLNLDTKIIREKEIVIREKASDIKIEKPSNRDCDELYNKSTEKIGLLEEAISKKDTIESNLNSVINNQNSIIAYKDKIISNKDLEIDLTKDVYRSRNKKFTIGVQIGYGFGVTTDNNKVVLKTIPYVGVGVSKTIFSF